MNPVFYTTISTGFGGILIVDQKPVSGAHGFGGEIANTIIKRDGDKVNYLNAGAVENEVSGTALLRKYKEKTGNDVAHAGVIFDLAVEGDEISKEIVENFERDLGQFYAAVSCVCDPEVFVLGGGVMHSKDIFLPKVVEHFKEMSHEGVADTKFLEAELEEPGIVGAAMLAKYYGF